MQNEIDASEESLIANRKWQIANREKSIDNSLLLKVIGNV